MPVYHLSGEAQHSLYIRAKNYDTAEEAFREAFAATIQSGAIHYDIIEKVGDNEEIDLDLEDSEV